MYKKAIQSVVGSRDPRGPYRTAMETKFSARRAKVDGQQLFTSSTDTWHATKMSGCLPVIGFEYIHIWTVQLTRYVRSTLAAPVTWKNHNYMYIVQISSTRHQHNLFSCMITVVSHITDTKHGAQTGSNHHARGGGAPDPATFSLSSRVLKSIGWPLSGILWVTFSTWSLGHGRTNYTMQCCIC